MEDETGKLIELRDNVVLPSEVTQPILGYGRLMEGGWSICATAKTLRNGDYAVPIHMQNRGIVMKGSVHALRSSESAAEGLKAELVLLLEKVARDQVGWKKHDQLWIGVHIDHKYQNSSLHSWHRSELGVEPNHFGSTEGSVGACANLSTSSDA